MAEKSSSSLQNVALLILFEPPYTELYVRWCKRSGYFPSYALGYMYAAQWKHAMDKDIPDFDELCAKGLVVNS